MAHHIFGVAKVLLQGVLFLDLVLGAVILLGLVGAIIVHFWQHGSRAAAGARPDRGQSRARVRSAAR